MSTRLINEFEVAVHEYSAHPKITAARVDADLDAINAARNALHDRFNLLYGLIFIAFMLGVAT